MHFLVLGCAGMAGHTISIYLEERGHGVTGFSRRRVSFLENQITGDARNHEFIRKAIEETEPDVVVNCIGVLNAFADADPEGASWLNGGLPHYLADITEDTQTRVFHMSTDCVFAGNTGPYTEEDTPDGESVYDRTKADGELLDERNLTFRNSIVGPDVNLRGIGLLNWFMKQAGPLKGWTRAMWTGLTTLELAKAMECAASENVYGLVNMVPEGNISKYELLQLFNKYLCDNVLEIKPDDSVELDKTLVRTNFSCSYRPVSYGVQVAEMAAWMRSHRDLYPHYTLGE